MVKKVRKHKKQSSAPADYDVGYGKPPAHSRFKPGQSGNLKGRTKGAKGTKTLLHEAFEKKITVHEGTKQRVVTKREALIESTLNRGLQKGGKDAAEAFRLMHWLDSEHGAQVSPDVPSADEDELLRAYEARLRRQFNAEMQNPTEPPAPTDHVPIEEGGEN